METTLAVGLLAFTSSFGTLLWTVYSGQRQQRKDTQQQDRSEKNSRTLTELNQKIITSTWRHEHRTQTLHRAREALITIGKCLSYHCSRVIEDPEQDNDENIMLNFANVNAAFAELRGITEAIDNTELSTAIDQLNSVMVDPPITILKDKKAREDFYNEASTQVTRASAKLHKIITQLLEKEG